MIELIFEKTDFGYQSKIDLGVDEAVMELDTGSPITTISVPNLLQITGETIYAFRKKTEAFLNEHKPLLLGVYGSQMNEVRHRFLPYLVKDVHIGAEIFPYFLFWVDITHLNSQRIVPTSILFGFDYIRQGKKFFDDEDQFHIVFEKVQADTFSVSYAMSNINDRVNEIGELIGIV